MPSRIRTITTGEDEKNKDVILNNETEEIQPMSASPTKDKHAVPDASKKAVTPKAPSAKKAPRKKKLELAPNQRKIASFFSVKAPSKSTSTKQTKAPASKRVKKNQPTSLEKLPKPEEQTSRQASVLSTESLAKTTPKSMKQSDQPETPMEDIRAIVLGAFGDSSNSMDAELPKSKIGKVRGIDVKALLPSLVSQDDQASSKKKSSTKKTTKVTVAKKNTLAQVHEKGATKDTTGKSSAEHVDVSVQEETSSSAAEKMTDVVETVNKNLVDTTSKKRKEPSVTEEKVTPVNVLLGRKKAKNSDRKASKTKIEECETDKQGKGIVPPTSSADKDVVVVDSSNAVNEEKAHEPTPSAVATLNHKKNESDVSNNESKVSISEKNEAASASPTEKKKEDATEKNVTLSTEDAALLSKYESMKTTYTKKAKELIARGVEGKLSQEDFQVDVLNGTMKIPLAIDNIEGKELLDFKDEWLKDLSVIVQGSPLPLDDLSAFAQSKLMSSCTEETPISLESITSKIKIIASRTQYLFPIPSMEKKENDKIDLFSDNNPEFMWRWELISDDLLPPECKSCVKKARTSRRKLKNHEKAVTRLIQCIHDAYLAIQSGATQTKKQKLIAKVSSEEEKVLKYAREEEKIRLQKEATRKKNEEKKKLEEERKKLKKQAEDAKKAQKLEESERKKAEKAKKLEEAERKKKEAERKKAEAELKKKEAAEKKAASEEKRKHRMMSFFTKPASPKKAEVESTPAIAPVTLCVIEDSSFQSDEFWASLGNGKDTATPFQRLSSKAKKSRKRKISTAKARVFVPTVSDNPFAQQVYDEERILDIRNKYKFLSFREDYRPPYHGTWSKPQSSSISGRTPFAKDTEYLDYEIDSEAEWEEGDDEQGEDCSENGNDEEDMLDDEEGDTTKYNYQDGWLAEDGDLELEDDDEETQQLRKRKFCAGETNECLNASSAACVVAPLKGGIPQCEINSELIEGIDPVESKSLVGMHLSVILSTETICFDAFPPAAKKAVAKKSVSSSQNSKTSNEMSQEDVITFAKFVHNSTFKSKDMVVEELRNKHPKITSSRAQATRKLDSIANKRRLKNGGGVIWEVKNDVLKTLGLEELIKSPEPEEKDEKKEKKKAGAKKEEKKGSKKVKGKKSTKTKAAKATPSPTVAKTGAKDIVAEKTSVPTLDLGSPKIEKDAAVEKEMKGKGEGTETQIEKTETENPSLVSPSSMEVVEREISKETSPSRKRKAPAGVSKGSVNLLASFLKKKKPSTS